MPRAVEEWVGATDETPAPRRIRMRVYEAYAGCCCCGLCGATHIWGKPWQIDHVIALINGGENRESNLAPILASHHKVKTRADLAIKSKTARMKASYLGVKAPGRPMPGSKASKFKRKINGQVVLRDTE